jgi:ATP-dependent DNA helicase RecG
MTELELRDRIARGENLHTEFKGGLPDKEALAKSVVCFANTDGGQLIVGVGDAGEILGIADLDASMRLIDDIAFNRCEPPVTVVQETIKVEDKTVLIVNVPKGSQRPYRTGSGLYYIRSTNKCRQASRDELLRLFQATESLYFDESAIFRVSLKDLNLDYFEEFLKTHVGITASEDDLKSYLENLRLMVNGNPTLTGLLFFGKKPQSFLPTAKIIAAYIPGTDISIAPLDKKEIAGRIPEMIDDAGKFLRLYLREEHRIEGFASELRFELPEQAWREALVNAVAHRDYTISAPIRLLVFDDRIEFRSPGKLPNTVTIPRIRLGGAHVLRNPTIYNLLGRMGLITDLGSGVRRIIKSVYDHLQKEVLLEETETEFILTIPRNFPNDK